MEKDHEDLPYKSMTNPICPGKSIFKGHTFAGKKDNPVLEFSAENETVLEGSVYYVNSLGPRPSVMLIL